jgi:hypothetical protein
VLLHCLPQIVIGTICIMLEPLVSHTWLVMTSLQHRWVLVVELVTTVIAIEVDVDWVLSELGPPDGSAILEAELWLDQFNARAEECERVLQLPEGLPSINVRARLHPVPLLLVSITLAFVDVVSVVTVSI